jgi:exosome complex RNA-binding protein Rrp4
MDGSAPARREVVIPGDPLDGHGLKPGSGTFKEGGRIYAARLGIVSERDGFLSVVPLTGRYIPPPSTRRRPHGRWSSGTRSGTSTSGT